MRVAIGAWIVCLVVAYAAVAPAAPGPDVSKQLAAAIALIDAGDHENALVQIAEGLAIAPGNLELLRRKARSLYTLRDYAAALEAYKAFIAAGPTGRPYREAQKAIAGLNETLATFLDITVTNGPASIYIEYKTDGLFCTAAPTCNRAVPPSVHTVLAERDGFERWSQRVTVASRKTTPITITLVEKRSLLTVRTMPPGATVTVDGKRHDAPGDVSAGKHVVVVSASGHVDAQREVVAQAGAPIDLDLALDRRIPVRVQPAGATLVLDGKPVAVQNGAITVSPGDHVLVARAKGHVERRVEISTALGARDELMIALVREPAAPRDDGPRSGRRAGVGLAVAAAGGVSLVAGFGFGYLSRESFLEARELCGSNLVCDTQDDFTKGNELVSEARSRAAISTILVVAGSAAIVAGGIVWYTAPRERNPRAARVVPTASGAGDVGIAVVGRF